MTKVGVDDRFARFDAQSDAIALSMCRHSRSHAVDSQNRETPSLSSVAPLNSALGLHYVD